MCKRVAMLFAILVLISGCGQLITPPPAPVTPVVLEPTATPLPTGAPRATSTPAPATPEPTATPTVTPTPIVYRVESRDTLLAIAAKFSVPAERIQEVNGIIDPRRLQIGQELIIPQPEPDSEEPPTPTPIPPPMAIRKLNFQSMPLGGMWALGEVFNLSSDPVSEVVAQVSLFDGEGQLLASETAYPQLDVIPPQKAVAFAILFDSPPRHFAQYQALVLAGVPTAPNTRYYLDLLATDVQAQATDATRYRVSGDLQNVGPSDVEQLRVLVTAYDEEDHIIAVRQTNLPVSVLRAGATTPFEAELTVVGSSVITYSVQAQGLRVE
jgi:LysM repeat protein